MIYQDKTYNYLITAIFLSIVVSLILLIACEKIEPVRIIKIETVAINDIQYSSSTAEGTFIDMTDGGITEYGHCWHTTENPTINNSKTTLGNRNTKGSFQSQLEGLVPGTKYYVRAYGQKGDIVTYGKNVSFFTLAGVLPSVSTSSATLISTNSATCGGEVTSDGGYPVTARGVCWNTTGNPTPSQNSTSDGNGTGSFSSQLNELTINTKYFVKAYATNKIGTSLGNEISFSTAQGDLPVVNTYEASEVTMNSAICGGEIADDGGYSITARGICWNTIGNPTLEDNSREIGAGTGSFDTQLTGLTKRTTYYVRAYATNNLGLNYGNQIIFTTSDLPSVSTVEIANVKSNSITCVGVVNDEGGTEVFDRGFCWDIDPEPTIDAAHLQDGSGTGEFECELTELPSATQFFIRAYATNLNGTVYGEQLEAITSFIDTRNYKVYPVVLIDEQYWMAENLNIGTYVTIATGQSDNGVFEKYCYDDDEANCDTYGGIYTWEEMMQYTSGESVQGVCPSGWHLPSDEEWKALEMALGMSAEATDSVARMRGINNEGGKLKFTGTDFWNDPNQGATNETGFSALPIGYSIFTGSFEGIGEFTTFWTTTWGTEFDVYYRYLHYNSGKIGRYLGYPANGTPVRCIKD